MINKIISGGQTGADRGGLEAARELGISTGGYCPKGYLTENGPDLTLKEFGLIEMETSENNKRTTKNIEISDATVIIGGTDLDGMLKSRGSIFTFNTAMKLKKLVLVNPDIKTLKDWLNAQNFRILNVAGDRESDSPGIQVRTKEYLLKALE
ncbi:MAG: putative molybdenum carrier protein [Candidatus Kapaibacterium sp.]